MHELHVGKYVIAWVGGPLKVGRFAENAWDAGPLVVWRRLPVLRTRKVTHA